MNILEMCPMEGGGTTCLLLSSVVPSLILPIGIMHYDVISMCDSLVMGVTVSLVTSRPVDSCVITVQVTGIVAFPRSYSHTCSCSETQGAHPHLLVSIGVYLWRGVIFRKRGNHGWDPVQVAVSDTAAQTKKTDIS